MSYDDFIISIFIQKKDLYGKRFKIHSGVINIAVLQYHLTEKTKTVSRNGFASFAYRRCKPSGHVFSTRICVYVRVPTENMRNRPAISNNIALPTLHRHRRRDSRLVRPARKARRGLISPVHTRERRFTLRERGRGRG